MSYPERVEQVDTIGMYPCHRSIGRVPLDTEKMTMGSYDNFVNVEELIEVYNLYRYEDKRLLSKEEMLN